VDDDALSDAERIQQRLHGFCQTGRQVDDERIGGRRIDPMGAVGSTGSERDGAGERE
jgi:hypothetical protein